MKGILEFNLNDEDDVMSHLRCVKSLDMAIALFQISQTLYNDDISADEIKNEIRLALSNNGIEIDQLIR